MKKSNLKLKKYLASLMLVIVLVCTFGIIKLGSFDRLAGKVELANAYLSSMSTKLSSNIFDITSDNTLTSNGYDEVSYAIRYKLTESNRDVIIEGTLNDDEKFATFKNVVGNNISSTITNNGKKIEVIISNVPNDKEITTELAMLINGAPDGYQVKPQIKIKESTSENYEDIPTSPVVVSTNSLKGIVRDENNDGISNIIVSLYKGKELVKETYTNEEGNYIFSDIEEGNYTVKVNEDIYEKISLSDVNVVGNSTLDLITKRVYPFNIEMHKYITKVDAYNMGSLISRIYNSLSIVNFPVEKLSSLSGKVYYKVVVENTGEKEGIISIVKDELPEFMSFDPNINSGWELVDGIIYDRNLEGIKLLPGEKREDTLILNIVETKEAKTYLNRVTADGEIYEHVVYLLDGKTYKEEDVIEGEKIIKPADPTNNFAGWYTDTKYTNLYNYNNPVIKDLILYGRTNQKHKVNFIDKNPKTGNENPYIEREVSDGEPVEEPNEHPEYEGYEFTYWCSSDMNKYDFNQSVTGDLKLYNCNKIKKYDVNFYDYKDSKTKTIKVEYENLINQEMAPTFDETGYTFICWTKDKENCYDFTTPVKEEINLYPKHEIIKYTFKFDDENRVTTKEVNYGEKVEEIENKGKEGHTFKCFSEDKENCFNFETPIKKDTTVYAIYKIKSYDVNFYDYSDANAKTIKVNFGNNINKNDAPSFDETGYTFICWTKDKENCYDFTTPVKSKVDLYPKHEKLKNAVIFDDENRVTTVEVEYGEKATEIANQGKEGHTFICFSEDKQNCFDFNTPIIKNTTVYAIYEINKFDVNFFNYEDEVAKTVKVNYGNNIKEENAPTFDETGYTFICWTKDKENCYDFTTQVKKDINLYPKHEIITNTFIFDDENRVTTKDVDYGKTVEEIASQGKEGHTFKCFSEDKQNCFDFNTPIIKNTTVYAIYEINKYTIGFIDRNPEDLTDTSYGENQVVEYKGKVVKPNVDPEKVGYTFKSWVREDGSIYNFDTPVTSDLTLISNYEINKYEVRFHDGNDVTIKEVEYKKLVTPIETPTKEHHIFKNWLRDDEVFDFNTPIVNEIDLYSDYEKVLPPIVSHTPTMWTNGSVSVNVEADSSINTEGYSFLYKTIDSEYNTYNGEFTINENTELVIKSQKENVDSEVVNHEIKNIDKLNPIITLLSENSANRNSATMNIGTLDNESGVSYIEIYQDGVKIGEKHFECYEETEFDAYEECRKDLPVEKKTTYTATGLSEATTYTFKIKVYDKAGNSVMSDEIEITTTTPHIVARLIGYNNELFSDTIDSITGEITETKEEKYIVFESLEEAFDYEDLYDCKNVQCTIQMVTGTNESVEVLEGQDITLDLNGKVVSGIQNEYTIKNNGKFTLLDNELTNNEGKLINNDGVAILNKTGASLTVGEGYSDRKVNDSIVSTTKPYIYGEKNGIYKEDNSYLAFFDGNISSASSMLIGSGAIYGSVDATEYSYESVSSTNEIDGKNIQSVTLNQIVDPEARVNKSIYYAKLNNAVKSANTGETTKEFEDGNLMTDFESDSIYKFEYDEDTNTLKSNNDAPATKASSSLIIDLENYEEDKILTIDYLVNPASNGSKGTPSIIVYEYIDHGKRIGDSVKVYDFENQSKVTLTKGKEYIVVVSYTQPSVVINPDSEEVTLGNMEITNVTLSEAESNKYDTTISDETFAQGATFYYDEDTNTLRSNTQYSQGYSVAYSEMEIDLTDKEGEYDVLVNASVEAAVGEQFYATVILTDTDFNFGDYYYDSRNILRYQNDYLPETTTPGETTNFSVYGPTTGKMTVSAGKKYYLRFMYYKSGGTVPPKEEYEKYNNSDQMIIHSIDVVKSDKNNIENIGIMDLTKTKDYLNNITKNSNGTFIESEGKIVTNNLNAGQTSVFETEFDMTQETKYQTVSLRFKETDPSSGSKVNNYKYSLYRIADANGSIDQVNIPSSGYITDSDGIVTINYTLKNGYKYKMNFSYTTQTVIGLERYSNIEIYELSTGYLKNFVGNNFNAIYNYGDPYLISTTMYNSSDKYEDSYIKLDLSDYTEDQILLFNGQYNLPEYERYFIYLTDNNRALSRSDIVNERNNMLLYYGNNRKYPGTKDASYYYVGSNYNQYFVLEKGNIYYLHFANISNYNGGTEADESNTYGNQSFRIRNMSLTPVSESIISYGSPTIFHGTEDFENVKLESNNINLTNGSFEEVTLNYIEPYGYEYDEELGMYRPLNTTAQTAAAMTLKFDLTDSSEDKYYQFINEPSFRNQYNYVGFYTVGEKENIKHGDLAAVIQGTQPSGYQYIYHNSKFKLEKGKIHYVQILSGLSSNISKNNYCFAIEELTYNNETNEYEKSSEIRKFNEQIDTVQLLKNIPSVDEDIEVAYDQEVVLDMNGYTLNLGSNKLKNAGNLTITDTKYKIAEVENAEYLVEQQDLYNDGIKKYKEDLAIYQEYLESDEHKIDMLLSGQEYEYSGKEEKYLVPKTGTYEIEVWGAQGGNASTTYKGGYGGYATGLINLSENTELFINVGGAGKTTTNAARNKVDGGYNGGGSGYNHSTAGRYAGSGGGATHIATSSGLLSSLEDNKESIIIVAGGGGGAWYADSKYHSDTISGTGGGATGGRGGSTHISLTTDNFGTQETGYAFGQGYNGISAQTPGGGGGYYGGISTNTFDAGGGSGYIGNELLNNKKMVMYATDERYINNEIDTKTEITTNVSKTPTSNSAKEGNGYVKITPLFTEEEIAELRSTLTKTYDIKEEPKLADYLKGVDFAYIKSDKYTTPGLNTTNFAYNANTTSYSNISNSGSNLLIRTTYNNTSNTYYKTPIKTNQTVEGTMNLYTGYSALTGTVYVGLAKTNNRTIDDYVVYEKYTAKYASTSYSYLFNNNTSDDLYLKIIVVHPNSYTNSYTYSIYALLNGLKIYDIGSIDSLQFDFNTKYPSGFQSNILSTAYTTERDLDGKNTNYYGGIINDKDATLTLGDTTLGTGIINKGEVEVLGETIINLTNTNQSGFNNLEGSSLKNNGDLTINLNYATCTNSAGIKYVSGDHEISYVKINGSSGVGIEIGEDANVKIHTASINVPACKSGYSISNATDISATSEYNKNFNIAFDAVSPSSYSNIYNTSSYGGINNLGNTVIDNGSNIVGRISNNNKKMDIVSGVVFDNLFNKAGTVTLNNIGINVNSILNMGTINFGTKEMSSYSINDKNYNNIFNMGTANVYGSYLGDIYNVGNLNAEKATIGRLVNAYTGFTDTPFNTNISNTNYDRKGNAYLHDGAQVVSNKMINEGTMVMDSANAYYGILNRGDLTIKGTSNIISSNGSAIMNEPLKYNYNNLYVYKPTSLTIGEDDGEVNTDIAIRSTNGTPAISGNCYQTNYSNSNNINIVDDLVFKHGYNANNTYGIVLQKLNDNFKITSKNRTGYNLIENYYQDNNLCEVNYYDGLLYTSAVTDSTAVIDIPLDKIASNNDLFYSNNDTNSTIVLKDLEDSERVNSIESNGTSYKSLQSAIDAAPSNANTIIDINNTYDSANKVVIPKDKDITINYNAGVMSNSFSKKALITNNGKLTVTGEGTNNIISVTGYENNNQMTIDGTTQIDKKVSTYKQSYLVKNNGNMIISDVTSNELNLLNNNSLTIDDGYFTSNTIYTNGSNTTINGGIYRNIHTDSSSDVTAKYKDIIYFINDVDPILEPNKTRIVLRTSLLEKPLIKTKTNDDNAKAKVQINNVDFREYDEETSSDYRINYLGEFNTSDVILNNVNYDGVDIYSNFDSSLTIKGGNYNTNLKIAGTYNQEESDLYGKIYLERDAIANVKSGSITQPKKYANSIATDEMPIMTTTNNIINIGVKGDNQTSKENPKITGDGYCFNNVDTSNKINVYDGIFKSAYKPINATISEIEDGYDMVYNKKKNPQEMYLDIVPIIHNYTSKTDYYDIQEAFNDANIGDELILLRDYTNGASSDSLVVSEEKDFTLYVSYILDFDENDNMIYTPYKDGDNIEDISMIETPQVNINNIDIKDPITNVVTEVPFIINKGKLTIQGSSINRINIETKDSELAPTFNSISGARIVINEGTINLYEVSAYSYENIGTMFKNTSTGTMNVRRSSIKTNYNTVFDNAGILNIIPDNNGTSDCYTPTIINVMASNFDNYYPKYNNDVTPTFIKYSNQLNQQSKYSNINIKVPIFNTGTINANNLFINANYGYTLIQNEGDIILNNTSLSQAIKGKNQSGNYEFAINPLYYYKVSTSSTNYTLYQPSLVNTGNISMNNVNTLLSNEMYNFGTINIDNSTLNSVSHLFINDKGKISIDNSNITTGNQTLVNASNELLTLKNSVVNSKTSFIQNDTNAGNINIDNVTFNMDSGTNFAYNYDFMNSCSNNSASKIAGNIKFTYNFYSSYYVTLTNFDESEDVFYSSSKILRNSEGLSLKTSNAKIKDSTINYINASGTAYYPIKITDSSLTLDNIKINKTNASYSYAIQNKDSNINILNSNIPSMYIDNADDNNSINIGTKDNNNDDSSSIDLISCNQINNKGINLYDGYVVVDSDITCTLNEVENGYNAIGDGNKRELSKDDVIINMTKDILYSSIQEAFDSAEDGDQLRLLTNVSMPINNYDITINKNIEFIVYNTLDANIVNNASIKLTGGRAKVVTNKGEMTINGTYIYNLINEGNLTLNGSVVSVNNTGTFSVPSGSVTSKVTNSGSGVVSLGNSYVKDFVNSDTAIVEFTGSARIDNLINTSSSLLEFATGSIGTIKSYLGNLLLNGVSVSTELWNSGNITMNTGYVAKMYNIASGTIIINGGTVTNIDNVFTKKNPQYAHVYSILGLDEYGNEISNFENYYTTYNCGEAVPKCYKAEITINDGNINYLYNKGIVNFLGGTITKVNNYSFGNQSKLVIGNKDGVVSTTSPKIYNPDGYAIYYYDEVYDRDFINNMGDLEIYDGIFTGQKGLNVIKGVQLNTVSNVISSVYIRDIEDNYDLVLSTDLDENGNPLKTESVTLKYHENTDADTKIACVNGICYKSLQEAINASVQNYSEESGCPEVTVSYNVELDEDLVILEGYEVTVNLDNHNLNDNGYDIPSGIKITNGTRNNTDLSSSLSKFLQGRSSNSKDIIISKMEDGSSLSSEKTYKLYKYIDNEYKELTMDSEGASKYYEGKETTELKSIKGRIYLYGMEEGTYLLRDNTDLELEFTIYDDGTLSSNVKENIASEYGKVSASAVATLIISIQTGIFRVRYILIGLVVITLIILLFLYKKNKSIKTKETI